MRRRPPRSTQSRSSAASDVYKRQVQHGKVQGYDEDRDLYCVKVAYSTIYGAKVSQSWRFAAQDLMPENYHPDKTSAAHRLLCTLGSVDKGWRRLVLREMTIRGYMICLLYTSPSPRDRTRSRMPSSA
eukprot:TRINITY_DN13079_c0_g1_i1.p1 TRINITY_DN13079_c0_g1~~TRINITY_DN13079_c0_g1_i1.p1  ORF type:complete len:128 (+),score=60.94 TRINITY_DN13079_c0_g1_i1:101-484(+)